MRRRVQIVLSSKPVGGQSISGIGPWRRFKLLLVGIAAAALVLALVIVAVVLGSIVAVFILLAISVAILVLVAKAILKRWSR